MTSEHRGDPQSTQNQNACFFSIPINTIDTEGQSVREAMDNDHVVELAMSIAKHGLLEPVVLHPKENQRYQLEAGFHRLCACLRLKWETIPAHIRTNPTGPVKAIALIENIVRRDMSLDEEVKAINYLSTEENLSPSSICDLLGKSRGWVDQRLAIPNYQEDVIAELFDGHLTIGKAEIISKIQDDGTRALILNQVISAKLTAKQTNDLVDMYLASPTIQSAIDAGLQKAKEIQETPKNYRKCELCQTLREMMYIKFITVCVDAEDCNQRVLRELKEREDTLNAH